MQSIQKTVSALRHSSALILLLFMRSFTISCAISPQFCEPTSGRFPIFFWSEKSLTQPRRSKKATKSAARSWEELLISLEGISVKADFIESYKTINIGSNWNKMFSRLVERKRFKWTINKIFCFAKSKKSIFFKRAYISGKTLQLDDKPKEQM